MADEVLIRCLCGQLSINAKLKCTLPYKASICHCNICRHVTGALTFTGIGPIDTDGRDILASGLTSYATSENVIRKFCPTCGSHAIYHKQPENRWMVCSGAIDKVLVGEQTSLEQSTMHEFLADTLDGGLSWLLPDLPCYLVADNETPVKDLTSALQTHVRGQTNHEDHLLVAKCHCGKVKLNIGRPDDGKKWKGGICVCRSCRLALGQTLVPWLFNVPTAKVMWSDGTGYESSAEKYVKKHNSSEGVWRDFCTTCGASVSWQSKKEPGEMDIAAGILRSPDGALAKSFIDWDTTKLHFAEDALDEALIRQVSENLKNITG